MVIPVGMIESPEDGEDPNDWIRWAARYEKSIDFAPSLEWLNEQVELNAAAFANFKKAKGSDSAHIEKITANKRGFFAAEPAEAAE
jgi:hypothetical protein